MASSQSRQVELGVFLPIAEGGFIFSESAPPTPATYSYNEQTALLAEELGFDFVMSQIKWRGFGGPTRAWDSALESHTLMSMLGQRTKRIRLIASVNILSIHPAIFAKMVATTCDAVGDRYGINIVTGSFPSEMAQFGLWGLDHDRRYDKAHEYMEVLTRLWSEDSVSFAGQHFTLEDAQAWPKPCPLPKIVCAGVSPKGLDFTTTWGDAAFISASGGEYSKVGDSSRQARKLAADRRRTIQTYTTMMIIPGESVADAERRKEHILDGADQVALRAMATEYGLRMKEDDQGGGSQRLRARAMMGPPVAGDAESMAEQISAAVEVADVDGLMLEMPDYIQDQRWFGENVMPLLAERGLLARPQVPSGM